MTKVFTKWHLSWVFYCKLVFLFVPSLFESKKALIPTDLDLESIRTCPMLILHISTSLHCLTLTSRSWVGNSMPHCFQWQFVSMKSPGSSLRSAADSGECCLSSRFTLAAFLWELQAPLVSASARTQSPFLHDWLGIYNKIPQAN